MDSQIFGSYTVTRTLSRGGPVEVYEARDAQLERQVAIKVLHPPPGADAPAFEERFRELARRSAGLRHPHIVQVHGFEVASGLPYMVMEYLPGGTLAERLAEVASQGERLSLPEISRILEPLADALDAAHAQGLIHGALTPANVLFTARGQPVLTDFGIAQLLGPLSLANPAGAGLAAYVSPEQAAGKPLSAASDNYVLGILAYEMVCGQPPFAGGTPAQVMLQQMTEPPPAPGIVKPDLPEPLGPVLVKALAKDPAARYGSCRDLARAFAAAAHGRSAAIPAPADPAPTGAESGEVKENGEPAWLAPLMTTAEVIGPLVGRTPASRGASQNRRALIASVLSVVGILLAVFQLLITVSSLAKASLAPLLAPLAAVLPYLPFVIAALLVCGGLLALFTALRPGPGLHRRKGTLIFGAATLLIGLAWGGWTLYDRLRPPPGVIITVADFVQSGTRKVDFGHHIYEALRREMGDAGEEVTLQRANRSFADEAAARQYGTAAKATLVIYGQYDDASISPRVALLRFPSLASRSGSPLSLVRVASAGQEGLARPDWSLSKVAPYVREPVGVNDFGLSVQDGSQQMTYISMVLLGLIYYANGDDPHALAYYDKALSNAPAGSGIRGLEVPYFHRAVLLSHEGRHEEAIADLRQALAIKPDLVEAHRNLAILYASTCAPAWQLDAAIAEAQTAVRLQPDDVEGRRLMADLYRQAGRYEEALAELAAAEALDANDYRTHQLLASVYDQAGQPDRAQAAGERSLALLQQSVGGEGAAETAETHLSLGDAYLMVGRLDEAVAEYEAARQSLPSDPRPLAGLGNAYYWQGRYADAEREYGSWIAVAPEDADAHLLLGMRYLAQGDEAQALPELERAAALATCSTAEHKVLGGAYFDAGRYEDAAAQYQKAVEIDPNDADAFYLLGAMFENQAWEGQVEQVDPADARLAQAATALEKAVSLRPNFSQAQFALGNVYMQQEVYEKAALAWEAVVAAGPPEQSHLAALAHAYSKLGRHADEASAYEQALALGDDANLRTFLGLSYLQQGKPDAAIAEYQHALSLDPFNPLAHLGLAEIYDAQSRLAEAAASYEQVLALGGGDAYARRQLAGVYERQGKNEEAVAELTGAAGDDPGDAATLLQLADLYGRMNQLEDAAAAYGRVLSLKPESAPAHSGLASIEYKRCNLGAATQAAGRAAAIAPDVSLYRGIQASLYEAQGRTAEAAALYDELAAAPPADAIAHLLAGSYLARQQAENADSADAAAADAAAADAAAADAAVRELQVSQEAATGMPGLASLAHHALGQVYYAQGKLVAAESEFAAALAVLPANADAQAALGDLALREGDAAAALAAYDAAAALLPAYALQSADNAATLAVTLPARRGLALARLAEGAEGGDAGPPQPEATQPATSQQTTSQQATSQPATPQQATAAFDEAIAQGRALLARAPQWPAARFALANAYLARGDAAQGDAESADAEFKAAIQCDRSLAVQRRLAEANLALLRGEK